MKFIKKNNKFDDPRVTEFIENNIEALMKKPLNESDIVGTLEIDNESHAHSVCNQLDNAITALESIRNEIRPRVNVRSGGMTTRKFESPQGEPTTTRVINNQGVVPEDDNAPLVPKKGQAYRQSLAEAIKSTQTAQGINNTQGSF